MNRVLRVHTLRRHPCGPSHAATPDSLTYVTFSPTRLVSIVNCPQAARIFYGRFYGQMKFCGKAAQFCDTHCKLALLGNPYQKHAAQRCEKLCNSLGLNYKSAALPAELCRRFAYESCFQRVDQVSAVTYLARCAARNAIVWRELL